MKKKRVAFIPCMAGFVARVLSADLTNAQAENPDVDPVSVTVAMGTGLNYSTGFEPEEGFVPGYIGGSNQPAGCGGVSNPCWGTREDVGRSLVEGHIDTVHPFAGSQHLRIARDPAIYNHWDYGIAVDARYPQTSDVTPQPTGPTTITLQLSIDNILGQSFRIQPQSVSQGLPATSVFFHYSGGIYGLEACDGSLGWEPIGALIGDYYQELRVAIDPCNGTISYRIRYPYSPDQERTHCVSLASNVEQLLVFGDNYPGSLIDVDNIEIESGEPCVVYGACCDTNGFGQGCVDSALEPDCGGDDEFWTPHALCAEIECACIPDCANRECGGDGCGGGCGTCGDGDFCNGIEFCTDGHCWAGMPSPCDDAMFCNGLETCSAAVGCLPGAPPCGDDETCDEATETCAPNAIPTISQWGLVVLTIIILVAAKVQFRRRGLA